MADETIKDPNVIELETEDLGVTKENDADENGVEPVDVKALVTTAISSEIARFDAFETRANELVKQYNSYLELDLSVKGNYDKLKKGIAELRTMRTSTAKDVKSAKVPFQNAIKSINEKGEFVEKIITALEDKLDKAKKDFDAEKQRLQDEERQKNERRMAERTSKILSLGGSLQGAHFVFEDLAYTIENIRDYDDDVFEQKVLPKFQEKYDVKAEADRVAAEQKKKDDELLEQQRLELKAAQDKLKKDQDELDEKKRLQEKKEADELAETNRLAAEKAQKMVTERINSLTTLQFQYSLQDSAYKYGDQFSVHVDDIKTLNEEQWLQKSQELFPQVEAAIADALVKEQEKKDAEIKAAQEKAVKDAEELRLKKEKEAAEARAEELARSSDTVQWNAFLEQLDKAKVPTTMASNQYKTRAITARQLLQQIRDLNKKKND